MIVVTACGLDGLLLLLAAGKSAGVGLWLPLRTDSQPSFPKNLIEGERCSDAATAGELSTLVGSAFDGSSTDGATAELFDADGETASNEAVASVSNSYRFAPTSTVSSLYNA